MESPEARTKRFKQLRIAGAVFCALIFLCGGLLTHALFIDEELYPATQSKDYSEMLRLLAWRANPNTPQDGKFDTPLMAAVENGDIRATTILLDHATTLAVRQLLISKGAKATQHPTWPDSGPHGLGTGN